MDDIFKTVAKTGFGLISSLGAANINKLTSNIGQTAEAICSLISVVIAVITVIYIYYKTRNEIIEFEDNQSSIEDKDK